MRRFLRLSLLPALLLAACSSDNPMAGHWAMQGAAGPLKVGLEFHGSNGKVLAHVDGPDGHAHIDGTYTYDAATKAVTVKGKFLGDAKGDTWTGTVAGDEVKLTSGADSFTFKKGGSAH